MNINEIMSILPHRYPFLLIDKVVSLDPPPVTGSSAGRRIVAIKNVTVNEAFFQGHFPGKPVMPGVLMIEALAQAAALLAYRPHPEGGRYEVAFAAIDNCRFRKPVGPGDQIKLCAEMVKDRGQIFSFRVEAFVDNELVAEADILAKSFMRRD